MDKTNNGDNTNVHIITNWYVVYTLLKGMRQTLQNTTDSRTKFLS